MSFCAVFLLGISFVINENYEVFLESDSIEKAYTGYTLAGKSMDHADCVPRHRLSLTLGNCRNFVWNLMIETSEKLVDI